MSWLWFVLCNRTILQHGDLNWWHDHHGTECCGKILQFFVMVIIHKSSCITMNIGDILLHNCKICWSMGLKFCASAGHQTVTAVYTAVYSQPRVTLNYPPDI